MEDINKFYTNKLKESEKWFFNTLNSIADAVIATDKSGNVKFLNSVAEFLTGWKQQESIGKPLEKIFNIINEKTREKVENPIFKVLKKGIVVSLANHIILIAKDGKERIISDSSAPIKDNDGNILGVVLIFRDITKRKIIERTFQKNVEKFRLLSEVITDFLYEWNIKTDQLEWHSNFDAALGYEKGQIPRTIEAWFNKIHPEDQKKLKNSIELHRNSLVPIYEEYRIQRKDGKWLYWIDQGVPIVKEGKPIKWIGGCQDITERVNAEVKMKELLDQSEFYKDLLAHDMRNILNNIKSSVQLLEIWKDKNIQSDKRNEMIKIIITQIERGASLISNVRKFSNLKWDEKVLKPVDVNVTLKNAINSIIKRFHKKEINLETDIPQGILNVKACDLLLDVFENILINAVLYNKNNIIKIWVKISKIKEDSVDYLKIEFMDNGIGIIDERKDLIFNRGYKKGKGTGGMGVGLSLVKKVINSYSGNVYTKNRVEADYTQGSNFIILLEEI